MLEYLSAAMMSFLSIEVILALMVGVIGGMIIGIIPGLGPSVGIALLLPISFSMTPTAALVMMTAMYTTGVYGGSITAVLCHTPGTAASAATTMDGYAMTQKGQGMEAISVVTVASVLGGIIGAICLILFAPALGKISQMFSVLEYFLVACFGVLVVAGLTGDNQAKGIFFRSLRPAGRLYRYGLHHRRVPLYLRTALAGGRLRLHSHPDRPVFHLPGSGACPEADAGKRLHHRG